VSLAYPPAAPPRRAGPDLDRIPELISKVRQVPSRLRRFTVTADEARKRHQLDAGLLEALISEGLPSAGDRAGRLFDDYDLGNIALHLGLMSVRRMAIRSWACALRRGSESDGRCARVSLRASCPVPGHGGPCQFAVLVPGGRRVIREGPADGSEPIGLMDVTISSRWPSPGPDARELLAEIDSVDFFLLPEAIRWDARLMFRAQISDCGAASAWLVSEARKRGLRARFSFGFLVAKPYSTPHCWPELYLDGLWVPFDPLIVKAMRTWAALDQADWPVHRSTGAFVARLGPRFTKVAAHGGIWSAVTLPTEYLP
jgi:hypothetical protein